MENDHPSRDLVSLANVSVQNNGNLLLDGISLNMGIHQQWAIIGSSGSGKTTLAKVLTGKVFYSGTVTWQYPEVAKTTVALIEQQHHFKNLNNTSTFYYQQRFNASEAADSMTVRDALGIYTDENNWVDILQLKPLLEKPILQLSNGENKRLQLARALLLEPAVLIADNPFIGLDVGGRALLHKVFNTISEKGIRLILITTPSELPDCITHVALLEKGKLFSAADKAVYQVQHAEPITLPHKWNIGPLQQLLAPEAPDFLMAVSMNQVTIRYGEKIILNNINWQVKKGECWNVSGPNGAGKSTLLSLITADNPQAYANNIVLFDQQRGTGESIWDIKKKIGFVSPELHLYFEQHISCFDVIASGLFDTIGLFRRLSAAQEETVLLWMRVLELTDIMQKKIFQLSAGQQRMALLARALVKNPPLLILDEPTQGLDEKQTARFKNLVDEICRFYKTTLIYVSHYSSDLPACIRYHLTLKNGVVQ